MAFSQEDLDSLADDFVSTAGPEIRTPRATERMQGGNSGFSHINPVLSETSGRVAAKAVIGRLGHDADDAAARRLKDLTGGVGHRGADYTSIVKAVKRKRKARASRDETYRIAEENARRLRGDAFVKARRDRAAITGKKHAKLTAGAVRKIRAIYAEGFLSQKEIGKRFGVSGPTVMLIVTRITWRHIK